MRSPSMLEASSIETGHKRWSLGDALAAGLLAALSTVLVAIREFQGLAGALTVNLTPVELIATRRNPLLETIGFPSGAGLTGVSLPLKGYELLDVIGLDVVGAARVMIVIEALWFFIGIAWAVRVALPSFAPRVAALAGSIATVGFVLAGNNLANWGFVWGWNYGFAYAVVAIAMAYALRRRWTAAALALGALAVIHLLVAVLAALTVLPLLLVDAVRRRLDIDWRAVGLTALVVITYLIFARGPVQVVAADLDVPGYLARIRAFQFHLFYEFDLEFLRPMAADLGAWALACFVVVLTAWRARESDHSQSLRWLGLVGMATLLSLIGWWHSSLAEPNTTILLLALHRSSIFVNLLVILVAIPTALGGIAERRWFPFAALLVAWMLIPRSIDRSVLGIGVLLVGLTQVGTLTTRSGLPPGKRAVFGSSLAMSGAVAGWFLFVAATANGTLADTARSHWPMITFVLVLVVLSANLTPARDSTNPALGAAPAVAMLIAVLVPVAITIGDSFLGNPRAPDATGSAMREDYVDVQLWAESNTSPDSVFLLPPSDGGFGWRVFSERASAGKPREWLHYAFLYSRDQATIDEGTRRAELFGIDVDDWLAANPQILAGSGLVEAIEAVYSTMDDRQLFSIARDLDAEYVLIDGNRPDPRDCFTEMYRNPSYTVFATDESAC